MFSMSLNSSKDLNFDIAAELSKLLDILHGKPFSLNLDCMSLAVKSIPKPMIILNGKPIIYYIMKHFFNYGFKNFYVAIGYKGKVLKNFLGSSREKRRLCLEFIYFLVSYKLN